MNFNSFTTSDNAIYSASVSKQLVLHKSKQNNHSHFFLFLCHLHSHCHCMQPIPMFYASVVKILNLSFLLPRHILQSCIFQVNWCRFIQSFG